MASGNDRIAGRPATSPQLELPPHLTEPQTVALIYDEVEGLNFYADFALVAEAFANPQIVNRQSYRRTVQSYLKDGSILPLPFRRLAEQDTAKASRLFQLLLKRPAFSWEADGEALLRCRKRAFFDKPALPSVTPLGDMALEHYRSAAPGQGERRLAGVLQIEAG